MNSAPETDLFETHLAQLVKQLHGFISSLAEAPTLGDVHSLCELAYASSLLKEEGRTVRARIVVAPPTEFAITDGPPEGVQAIRFSYSHELSVNEIKRLCPAAGFFHSMIGVWPGRDGHLRIWGILNTGQRWMNLAAGGRKTMSPDLPYPIIHVRDPGSVFFYQGYTLISEWRGRELHGPRLDVFQSRFLDERFADLRRRVVSEMGECTLPCSLLPEQYAQLSHWIALQFIKRSINLVRTSGHGGTVLILPEGERGTEVAERWIDCKYTAAAADSNLRFSTLWLAILRRVGELSQGRISTEEAWDIFRNSHDPELDRLEESFFELARLYSDLMLVDGALVLDQRLSLVGFGGEIRVDRNILSVSRALDLEGAVLSEWNVRGDGTRHRSVYRLCAADPEVVGFVISQDGQVRMIANVDENVVFWVHSVT